MLIRSVEAIETRSGKIRYVVRDADAMPAGQVVEPAQEVLVGVGEEPLHRLGADHRPSLE